jgi:hypothetical protein
LGCEIPPNSLPVVVDRPTEGGNIGFAGCQFQVSMVSKVEYYPVEGFYKYAPAKVSDMLLYILSEP